MLISSVSEGRVGWSSLFAVLFLISLNSVGVTLLSRSSHPACSKSARCGRAAGALAVLAQQVCFGRVGPDVFAAMSQPQSWPLSQDANKSSGVCSVCRATRQLHMKDGTVHKHGPRHSPCPGSHKLPLGAACPPSVNLSQLLPAASVGFSASPPSTPAGSSMVICKLLIQISPISFGLRLNVQSLNTSLNLLALLVPPILLDCCVQLLPSRMYILTGWLFSAGVGQYFSLQSMGANATMPHPLLNAVSQGSQLHRSHYTRLRHVTQSFQINCWHRQWRPSWRRVTSERRSEFCALMIPQLLHQRRTYPSCKKSTRQHPGWTGLSLSHHSLLICLLRIRTSAKRSYLFLQVLPAVRTVCVCNTLRTWFSVVSRAQIF